MALIDPITDALAAQCRAATRAAHRALDHHPLLAPLLRPGLTLTEYAQALAALYAPQAALESLLAGFAPAKDFPPRSSALAADLAALGLAPEPLRAAPPLAEDVSARLGCLYVLEGSNLGAAFIAQALAKHLPAAPRRFFAGGADPLRWERFWRFARDCRPQPERMIAAAIATFAFYRSHLDACLAFLPSRERRA
ncbi:MAG: biliverdin-producing heme oxygenase [Rhodocyclaceae bacterium]|nr:biliverdin-producing heme oxygenase [Rhodocyclaceae bacterium]